jgi:[glutamine synthetase] adenylyltransferase / [glutamine synthetase]-adenylyl-L-tyrosine phosphorylase
LCKARRVYGSPRTQRAAAAAAERAAYARRWKRKDADELRALRRELESSAEPGDLGVGPGGIADIEFLVQALQLQHARKNHLLRSPNTLAAVRALHQAGLLNGEEQAFLESGYRLLRSIQGRLRLMSSETRDQLPRDPVELSKLAHLLRYSGSEALVSDCERTMAEVRKRFDAVLEVAGIK